MRASGAALDAQSTYFVHSPAGPGEGKRFDAIDERMSEAERREDLYLSALGRYVAALGVRLEVRAVFDGEAIVVRRVPDDPSA